MEVRKLRNYLLSFTASKIRSLLVRTRSMDSFMLATLLQLGIVSEEQKMVEKVKIKINCFLFSKKGRLNYV